MSTAMETILVIGGTSGIGEAFAKRWYSQGKKLVLTGRREQKLKELQATLPGTGTYVMDNTHLPKLEGHVNNIFTQFPDIDTVWINSGEAYKWSLKDLDSISDQDLIGEITLNVTAPMILARHIIPRLIAKDSPATFLITSSGLAFVPNAMFPTYPSSKAYIHHFLTGLRGALQDTKVNVIELVPPMVATDFNRKYSDLVKNAPCMTLEDYVNDTFKILDNYKAEDLKEVPAGTARERVDSWRAGPGKYMKDRSIFG